jgi:hypothetical protein
VGLEAEGVEADRQQASFSVYLAACGEEGEEVLFAIEDACGEAEGCVLAPVVDIEGLAAEDVGVDFKAEFGWEAEERRGLGV